MPTWTSAEPRRPEAALQKAASHSTGAQSFTQLDEAAFANGPGTTRLSQFASRLREAPRSAQLRARQTQLNPGPTPLPAVPVGVPLQYQADVEAETSPHFAETASAPNHIGMPDRLKAGIEELSGISMDDVRVHRNSVKPAQLKVHAYAQGTDIHLAPGQESHLPHEAWHVVQQAQGRVRPTRQMKGGRNPINDDPTLEHEADVMGTKAGHTQIKSAVETVASVRSAPRVRNIATSGSFHPAQLAITKELKPSILNVVGEDHEISAPRRAKEKLLAQKKKINGGYWTEEEFLRGPPPGHDPVSSEKSPAYADTLRLRIANALSYASMTMEMHLHGKNIIKWPLPTRAERQHRKIIVNREVFKSGITKMLDLLKEFIISFKDQIKKLRVNEELDELKENPATSEAIAFVVEHANKLTLACRDLYDYWSDEFSKIRPLDLTAEHKNTLIGKLGVFALTLNLFTDRIEPLTDTSEFPEEKLNPDRLSEYPTATLVETVIQKRSLAMDFAANQRSGEAGIWKIGNLHVDDIINLVQNHDRQIKYNLVSGEDFEEICADAEKSVDHS